MTGFIQQCSNCRFWERLTDELSQQGMCLRFPPVLPTLPPQVVCGESDYGVFPLSGQSAWCGEWQRQDEEEEDS